MLRNAVRIALLGSLPSIWKVFSIATSEVNTFPTWARLGLASNFLLWTVNFLHFQNKNSFSHWVQKPFSGCLVSLVMLEVPIHCSLSVPCVLHRSMNKNCSNWLCLVWVQLQGPYLQIIWNQIMWIWWKNNLQWIQMGTLILNLLIPQSKELLCCTWGFFYHECVKEWGLLFGVMWT